MKPVPAVVLVGLLTVGGTWARDKELKIATAVGIAGVALGLAILHSMNADFAEKFGVLVVVGTAAWQAKPLFDAISKVVK